ncbi:MAG: 2-isopropylmalate synthase [Dehalobacterium sp.]
MNNLWKNENWWVSGYNYKNTIREKFNFPNSIQIHDATLRDGEQTPGVVLNKSEKIEIAKKLDEAGVHRIEAGMPAVSDQDRKAIEDIKRLNLKAKVFGFVRAKEEDIVMCSESGIDGVIIEVPIGRPKLELQFKWEVDRIVEMSINVIKKAKELGLYTVYFPYDTTRADEMDLEKLLTEIMKETPPDSIGLVDTMGCALPSTISYLTMLIKSKTNLPIEIHTHNDFGLALANSIEAVLSGASVVHTCINGMGERTGNCALEEAVMALKILLGQDLGINMQKIVDLSKMVEDITGFKLAQNKPIVGTGNFTRESGIGADALLNAPLAMFAINPAFINRKPQLVLGKKSGLTSIEMKLQELKIELDHDMKKSLLQDVKETGANLKRIITDEEFLSLVNKYKKAII